jgi:hypothetical protein
MSHRDECGWSSKAAQARKGYRSREEWCRLNQSTPRGLNTTWSVAVHLQISDSHHVNTHSSHMSDWKIMRRKISISLFDRCSWERRKPIIAFLVRINESPLAHIVHMQSEHVIVRNLGRNEGKLFWEEDEWLTENASVFVLVDCWDFAPGLYESILVSYVHSSADSIDFEKTSCSRSDSWRSHDWRWPG